MRSGSAASGANQVCRRPQFDVGSFRSDPLPALNPQSRFASFCFRLVINDRTDLCKEFRHVDLNHLPQSLVLQAEVVVCHQIASACDLSPLHRWVSIADFLGDFLDGLNSDLEQPHQGVVRHVLFREILEAQAMGEIDDLPAGILDVVEKQDVVTRHELPRARCWA